MLRTYCWQMRRKAENLFSRCHCHKQFQCLNFALSPACNTSGCFNQNLGRSLPGGSKSPHATYLQMSSNMAEVTGHLTVTNFVMKDYHPSQSYRIFFGTVTNPLTRDDETDQRL